MGIQVGMASWEICQKKTIPQRYRRQNGDVLRDNPSGEMADLLQIWKRKMREERPLCVWAKVYCECSLKYTSEKIKAKNVITLPRYSMTFIDDLYTLVIESPFYHDDNLKLVIKDDFCGELDFCQKLPCHKKYLFFSTVLLKFDSFLLKNLKNVN